MNRFRAGLLLVAALVLYFNGISIAGDLDRFRGLKGTLEIAGGTAHLPVMAEAARRIHDFNPDIFISVTGGGTACGIQKVGDGLVDIGNTGRALTEAERARYRLVSHPLALDGIAVAVNTENPVAGFSSEQVDMIFTGRIDNWQELGGANAPIVRYCREKGSATLEVFEKKLLRGDLLAECNSVSSNGAMRNIISLDRNGIGYLSIGHLGSEKVKAVAIDGVVPSQQNALSGKYTVARTLFMNTGPSPSRLTTLFVEYLKSPEGAEIIKDAGYIPIR
ncbi:MAG: phosphate ABC transporter substrate-binding protein [Desulfobulbaceae bacterium]|nr:phosphate ABC transporter substrate-binding protein [Desulfobulbaceae bacterium]